MEGFSKKEFLSLKMPTEEIPVSDRKHIELALHQLGYENVTFPLKVLHRLYPLCRNADFDISVTLVHREFDWVVTDVEPGDRTGHHYGLAIVQKSAASIAEAALQCFFIPYIPNKWCSGRCKRRRRSLPRSSRVRRKYIGHRGSKRNDHDPAVQES